MPCPFLKKMNVKYCGLRPSTMIPLRGNEPAMDQCSCHDYLNCTLLLDRADTSHDEECCPHLCVSDVHYCELDPSQKLIPCNQATASRCMDGGHNYCQLFLAATQHEPRPEISDAGKGTSLPEKPLSAGISMPSTLAYAPNHMWYDHGDGGTCHVGVDAFFASMIEEIEVLRYTTHADNRRPTVRFTVGEVAFDLVFPHPMRGTEINPHLLNDPSDVLRDPYGRGWLFEGIALSATNPAETPPLEQGLKRGSAARLWMVEECDRLGSFVHENYQEFDERAGLLFQDGGTPHRPLTGSLDRRLLVRLHSEFFTINPGRVKA